MYPSCFSLVLFLCCGLFLVSCLVDTGFVHFTNNKQTHGMCFIFFFDPSHMKLCRFVSKKSDVKIILPIKHLQLPNPPQTSLADPQIPTRTRFARLRGASTSSSSSSRSFDVVAVVVEAGVIRLTIARQFLLRSDISVAVVDKAIPCSGAIGAGK